jgi:hypothetical protein
MADGDGNWQRFSVFDFIVEFLGSLVPGIVFTTATLLVLAWPFYAFITAFSRGTANSATVWPPEIWKNAELGAFLTLLCVSYVLGHLFFRQDPNDPDRASFGRLRRASFKLSRGSDTSSGTVTEQLKNEYACGSDTEVKFPYPFLHKYLEHRGLTHLLWFVLWKDEGKSAFRSKNYINVLKIRLSFYHPGQCISISRNEAHVRLISSTWHLCHSLILVSFVGVAFALLRVPLLKDPGGARIAMTLPLLAPAILVMAAAMYVRWKIEEPLHYMRLREIIFVLETAHTAFRHHPALIQDVFPDFKGEDALNKIPAGPLNLTPDA